MEKKLYSENQEFRIVESGNFNGYPYWITSLGTHLCAYIGLKNYPEDTDSIVCHGGITYIGCSLPNGQKMLSKYIIGWDYAHAGDKIYSFPEGHEWEIWEIRKEVIEVVKQLLEMGVK